jgi:hypothetical protein
MELASQDAPNFNKVQKYAKIATLTRENYDPPVTPEHID